MRRVAAFALGLGLALSAGLLAASSAHAEYYCSPGFEPSYGRCIATVANDQVELYLNDATEVDGAPVPLHHRRHHRHGLHERY